MTGDFSKPLLRAAEQGDLAMVQSLLAGGAHVDSAAPGSDSALCFAAMFGHPAVVRALLDAGADVNHRGSYGRTPLHSAVCRDLQVTKLLVARGADLRARNDGDEDVLAESIGREEAPAGVLECLLGAGFDLSLRPAKYYPGRSHLMWACFCGRTDLVEALLAAGVDPNEVARDGETALSKTLSSMKQERVPALLAALVKGGAAPSLPSGLHQVSLLMAVCRHGDLESALRLLDRGADPNERARGTPLTCAEESGNRALVDLLLERGATPEQPPRAPGVTEVLHAAKTAAEAAPGDPRVRLAWARALQEQGFRAAAQSELVAVERLGGDVPAELRAALGFENPAGVRWAFAPFAPATEGVAPALDDARFPGARVSDGTREFPLVIVLGPFCTRCDAEGTTVCSDCDGTGTRPGFFNADHDYPCDPRQTCSTCAGLKYVIDGPRFGKGACAHPRWAKEAEGKGYELERCEACGLVSTSCGGMWSRSCACGVCGHLACTCKG